MAVQLPTLTLNKYVVSFLILIAFYIGSQLIVFISERIVLRITKKTKTDVDDMVIRKANKPIALILVLWGVRLAINPIGLVEPVNGYIIKIIYSLIVIVVVYTIIKVFDIIIDQWGRRFAKRTRSKIDDELLTIFHRSSKIVFVIIGIIYGLNLWGIEVGPLVASLGIAGLAIAFALQTTLGNIFGGISLILDKTVKKGDIVQLDSGESGRIFDVGLRSTKIKTWNNELVTVPNGKLANSTIKNVTMPSPSIRIDLEFGVEYGSDPNKVKKVALDAVKKIKNVEKDPPPDIWFLNMADFALQFKIMFWVDDIAKKWNTHQEAITAIYKALYKHKIGIPFPTRTIYVKK